MKRILPAAAAAWVGCLLACKLALAAEPAVHFLAPERFQVDAGQIVGLHWAAGPAATAAPTPWSEATVDWFFIRGPGEQENLHEVRPSDAAGRIVPVSNRRAGVTLVGVDAVAPVGELSREEFESFLTANAVHGLSEAPALRAPNARPVRVQRVESAKTLIRVLDPGGAPPRHSAVATSKTGQRAELRALFDPTMLRPGSDLAIRVYVNGSSVAGAGVRATHLASGARQDVVADPHGIAVVHIGQRGVWRLEFHAARTPEPGVDADWTLYSATLSFEVTRERGDE